ncbi:hypothetical protein ABKN59_009518 [Abortiporus biennis]
MLVSLTSCIEYMNSMIRYDYCNRYRLRVPMDVEDYQVIQENMISRLYPHIPRTERGQEFQRKVDREKIYRVFVPVKVVKPQRREKNSGERKGPTITFVPLT